MRAAALDPAPRAYAAAVALLRRADRGAGDAPPATTVKEIEAWLLGDAMAEDDLLPFFESLVWRLVAAGLPLERASLHVGTLHPQVYGYAWNWSRSDRLCDELRVDGEALTSDAYRRNPLFQVIERGESFRGDPGDTAMAARHPLLQELARQGITDYVALPLRAGGIYHNAATVATGQDGGFTAAQLTDLRRILGLLALHVERHIALRLAGNVLDTYLGNAAGGRVLRGSIKRGAGESMRAIVWASDLRGFTDLADRLDGHAMIALLNAYFEALVGAVMNHGGEVLKFIGDGLLAVFPFAAFANANEAARESLAAAEEALAAVDRLTASGVGAPGVGPLRTGIALHEGDVFFGNVGAPERLDFTVIGPAVNAAARVEALTKAIGRPILITAPVAARLPEPLEPHGEHPLRGLASPIGIFSPAGVRPPRARSAPRRRGDPRQAGR